MRGLASTVVALSLLAGLGGSSAIAQPIDHPVVMAGFTYVPGQAGVFGIGTDVAAPLVVLQGDTVTASNLDTDPHTITADTLIGGVPLFDSPFIDMLESDGVDGVSSLGPGSYPFHCKFHDFMHGLLVVQ